MDPPYSDPPRSVRSSDSKHRRIHQLEALPQTPPDTRNLVSQLGLRGFHYGCGWNLRKGWQPLHRGQVLGVWVVEMIVANG